jgi:hypothetical protein
MQIKSKHCAYNSKKKDIEESVAGKGVRIADFSRLQLPWQKDPSPKIEYSIVCRET